MKTPEILTLSEAENRGLIKFWTGVPCNRCGELSFTYVKNLTCQNCNKIKMYKRYKAMMAEKGKEPTRKKEPRMATIPGARFIAGRCQSGSDWSND